MTSPVRYDWREDAFLLICFVAALLGLLMQVVIDAGGVLVALWLIGRREGS